MAFMTARKRVEGMGSAKEGTRHFWNTTVTSIALLILVPLFVFTLGPALGDSHIAVIARFSQPFPAIVAALTLVVGWVHFRHGVQVLLEDYTHGMTRQVLLVAVICLSYAAAATGLYALVRIAL